MTFLEAMAMGLAVVAPDRPTMNEYIRHGVDGYLYDPRKPDMVDLDSASVVVSRARQAVLEGRAAWLESTDRLLADILAEKPRPGAPSRRVLALAGLLTAGERAKSLVPPRHRAALLRATRLVTRARS